jgi:non-heme chloroperoxidase
MAGLSLALPAFTEVTPSATTPSTLNGDRTMTTIKTKDGTEIFYKDWGPRDAQVLVFHHGWPLSADDWDAQMLFFLDKGYRVIAHDRRGHGRSTQTATGNEMDTYAADVIELAAALDLKNAIHIGHSTGGGEVARYVARAEPGRVAKAVLIAAVPPIMSSRRRTQAVCRSRSSIVSAQRSRRTAPSSTGMSRPAPSMVSTGPARRCRKGSSTIGGARG